MKEEEEGKGEESAADWGRGVVSLPPGGLQPSAADSVLFPSGNSNTMVNAARGVVGVIGAVGVPVEYLYR